MIDGLIAFSLFVIWFSYLTITRNNRSAAQAAERKKQLQDKASSEKSLVPDQTESNIAKLRLVRVSRAPQEPTLKQHIQSLKICFLKCRAFALKLKSTLVKPNTDTKEVFPVRQVVWPEQEDYSRFETPTFFRKVPYSQASNAGQAI